MRERFVARRALARPFYTLPPDEVAAGVYVAYALPDALPIRIARQGTHLWAETSPRLRGSLLHLLWEWELALQSRRQFRIIARLGLDYDDAWQEFAFCQVRGLYLPHEAKLAAVDVLHPAVHTLDALRTQIEFADLHWVADRRSSRGELLASLPA